jgi:hypothetical protein
MDSGGSIKVSAIGEAILARPGSWNGAKAREGSPEDLGDPIRVHVKESGAGLPVNKGPGLEEASDLPGALRRDTNPGGSAWAAEAKQISDR